MTHRLAPLLFVLILALALLLVACTSATSSGEEGSVVRVETFRAGENPWDLLFDGRNIWVANFGDAIVT
jgi:hypothetical protein